MALQPVARSSLPEDVEQQLLAEILAGRWAPGEALPSERALAVRLDVNRGAVREALQRLATAGLVRAHQGSGTRVLDYRREAGLDLLPQLLFRAGGAVDWSAVRAVAELRLCIGADAARLAADRATSSQHGPLQARATAMAQAPDRPARQVAALALWEAVVDASDNIAYRLAFNSLLRAYEPVQPLLRDVLGDELDDVEGHEAVVDAVLGGDAEAAQTAACKLLTRGSDALAALATQLGGAS